MTRIWRTLAIVGLGSLAAPVWAQAPAEAGVPAEPSPEARAAYEEGKIAYRLGDFATAIEQFEKAYALTENPLILSDVGLCYRRLYTTSNDVSHLRKSVALLENFENELVRDPGLGDLDEVRGLIAQVKTMIAEHREDVVESTEAGPTDGSAAGDGSTVVPPAGDDPGKKPRLIGSVLVGVGAGVFTGGMVATAVMALRGRGFSDELADSVAMSEAGGCSASSASTTCTDLAAQQDKIRDNGRLANTLAGALGASMGLAGAGLIVGGAILLVKGKKKTRQWREGAAVTVLPAGPTGPGIVLSGRF